MINYLVSRRLPLHDLYACNAPNNTQGWPYGPSDGGTTANYSWDHGGDATAQRQAARTGLALLALSQGVPMITGGDDTLRTIRCNNNSYDVDSVATWLDPALATTNAPFQTFVQQLLAFRAAHAELRARAWDTITFHQASGAVVTPAYLADATQPVLAWLVGDVYVMYNRGASAVTATLPATTVTWAAEADTSGLGRTTGPSTRCGVAVLLAPRLAGDLHGALASRGLVMQQTPSTPADRSLAIFVAR